MIDIHTHILPGVDDGSPDMSTSFEIVKNATREGVTKIIATPHYWPGVYQPHWQEVLAKTDKLNKELNNIGSFANVLPGMEVHLDMELPKLLEKGVIGTLNNTGKYLLVELPPQSFPQYTEMVLCKLLSMGITPILAHPERNNAIIADPELLYNLVNKGVLVQITAASIIGAFGSRVEYMSKLMLEHGWVHFIATDCHDIDKRPYIFLEGIAKAEELLPKDIVQIMVKKNPEKLIKGEGIAASNIKPIEKNVKKCRRQKGKFFLKKNLLFRIWNFLTNKE